MDKGKLREIRKGLESIKLPGYQQIIILLWANNPGCIEVSVLFNDDSGTQAPELKDELTKYVQNNPYLDNVDVVLGEEADGDCYITKDFSKTNGIPPSLWMYTTAMVVAVGLD